MKLREFIELFEDVEIVFPEKIDPKKTEEARALAIALDNANASLMQKNIRLSHDNEALNLKCAALQKEIDDMKMTITPDFLTGFFDKLEERIKTKVSQATPCKEDASVAKEMKKMRDEEIQKRSQAAVLKQTNFP